jgi:hypothetical protein
VQSTVGSFVHGGGHGSTVKTKTTF